MPDRLAGPGLAQDRHGFLEAGHPLAPVDAGRAEIRILVAEADAENGPPSGDDVEHRCILGDPDRVVQREQQHGGPDPDAAGARRNGRQYHERRGQEAVLVLMMLSDEETGKSGRLRRLRFLHGLRHAAVEVVAAGRIGDGTVNRELDHADLFPKIAVGQRRGGRKHESDRQARKSRAGASPD